MFLYLSRNILLHFINFYFLKEFTVCDSLQSQIWKKTIYLIEPIFNDFLPLFSSNFLRIRFSYFSLFLVYNLHYLVFDIIVTTLDKERCREFLQFLEIFL